MTYNPEIRCNYVLFLIPLKHTSQTIIMYSIFTVLKDKPSN